MDLLGNYFKETSPDQYSKAAVAFFAALDHIAETSPSIAKAILSELRDQRQSLKMIASENYSSLAVQLAMGNCLTDKYAEGIPHHRFYAGCDNIDAIEDEACLLLKELFGCEHAYVQPHSGADANLVAYWAILTKRVQPKALEKFQKQTIDQLTPSEFEELRKLLMSQKLLGLSLNSGGHLTHGYRHNTSSKMFEAHFYEVDPKTYQLNYDAIAKQAREIRPDILLAGYSSHARKINFRIMKEIAQEVGATFMVDMAHFAGLVAGKVFTGDFNPIPFADIVTSTTHKTLRGPRGGFVLCTNEYKEFVDKGCPMVLGGPLPHVMAAKAIAFREAKTKNFQNYAQKVVKNAQALAAGLIKHGLDVLSGGTDNHMVVVNVSGFGLTGRHAEGALRQCGITVNRNAIPFDKNGPWYTSGIRLGTPALTTLGLGPDEMTKIAELIALCLKNSKPSTTQAGQPSKSHADVAPEIIEQCKLTVQKILEMYPLYPELDVKNIDSLETLCV